MANRRTSTKKTRNFEKKSPGGVKRVSVSMVFWVLFFIVLITIFFVLLPMVRKGITLPQKQIVTEQSETEEPPVSEPSAQEPPSQPKTPATKPPEKAPEKTPTKPPAATAKETPQEKPAPEKPPASPPANPPAQTSPQPERKPVETRDRSIYFMQESRDGADLALVKVNRKLAVSDSPLLDSLNALLAGPTSEEKTRGLINLIPQNSRIISAQVINNTVFLNFNEEFRYNTFGREGGAAQLKQIVWTATEFPNVQNVQIQIEGKTVDFLIEGIMIRNPIGR